MTTASAATFALQGSSIRLREQLIRRAGIAGGMRVLDIGCGIGDVSLLAARTRGPHNQVTGIDIDDSALTIGRQEFRNRASTTSHSNKPTLTRFAPKDLSMP